MQTDWPEHLPSEFYDALRQFNRGEYYRCHDTLEALWVVERRPVRAVYQGVLQVAVGCYHLTVRRNGIGATRKIEAGARRLENALMHDGLYGVRWPMLIAAADQLREHLAGLERIEEFDQTLLPHVEFLQRESI